MALSYYMDHNVPRAITIGLRLRDVDVLTAIEDGMDQAEDEILLDRASLLQRVLFTQDDDLLKEATKRQRENANFGGVIYAHQLRISIGECVRDLELIARVGTMEDVVNRVHFLPL